VVAAPIPANEGERLAKLYSYRILDTEQEPAFGRVAAIAARALDVPIALVSLIDERRQWFKACVGLAATETSRETAFCAYAILDDAPLVIPDALADPRFADNPHVTGAPFVRAYAGAPLCAPDGYKLGTLCAIDTKPRPFTEAQLATLTGLASVVVDEMELRIARLELAERAREHAEHRLLLQTILDSAGEGIIVVDTLGKYVFFNPAAQRIVGYGPEQPDIAAGARFNTFYPDGVTQVPREELPFALALAGQDNDGIELFVRSRLVPDGVHLATTGRGIRDEDGSIIGAVVTFRDVSPLRAALTQLEQLSVTDALTGIANHRAFRQRIDLLVAERARGRRFALVLIDVDHFKRFNDDHGHQTGDEVLASVAHTLSGRVRKTDLAARYGGEEFAVLLTDVDLTGALAVAEQLRAAIEHMPGAHPVTASFGVVLAEEGATAASLIAAADAALYAAKRAGRNRVMPADPAARPAAAAPDGAPARTDR
jgi:diguanylate cyclase (GGDEF)-like protein/PAS domain S-box-containing protein